MDTIHVLAAIIIIVCACSFGGCASNSETSSTTTASSTTPGQRSYGSEDLRRTGKRTSAEQLQAADPSVTAQGGH